MGRPSLVAFPVATPTVHSSQCSWENGKKRLMLEAGEKSEKKRSFFSCCYLRYPEDDPKPGVIEIWNAAGDLL
jgi:hypothetical protein